MVLNVAKSGTSPIPFGPSCAQRLSYAANKIDSVDEPARRPGMGMDSFDLAQHQRGQIQIQNRPGFSSPVFSTTRPWPSV
jgi:hypothetical protein